jgi:hypothetical protein
LGYDWHIVRTREWAEASKKPITQNDADALIKADTELSWSKSDYIDMRDPKIGHTIRYSLIQWEKQSAFWWYRDQILCKDPNGPQQRKMIQMANALRAMVVGDEGERYELRKSLFDGEKIVVIPWPN